MPLSCTGRDLAAALSTHFEVDGGAVRNGDTGNPIAGIFENSDVVEENGENPGVIVAQAVFTCELSKVPNLANGDTFLISGVTYTARNWMRDDDIVDIYMEAP